MEASQAFNRCMEQLLVRQSGCLYCTSRPSALRFIYRPKRQVIIRKTAIRSFTNGFPRDQEDASDRRPSTQNGNNSKGQRSSQVPRIKETVNAQPQTMSQDNGPRAMNLSPIATSPDYKPPPPFQTSGEAKERATSQLDRLLGLRQARPQSENTNTDQPQEQQRPVYNNDLFGPQSSIFQNSRRPSRNRSPGLPDIGAMLEDLSLSPGGPPKPSEINLRLKPTLGRQVDVNENRGMDVTRAFQMLEVKINKGGNAVKHDTIRQKYHVRAGQFRKMERRRRWRILFKEGFLAECAKIRKMIKQGW